MPIVGTSEARDLQSSESSSKGSSSIDNGGIQDGMDASAHQTSVNSQLDNASLALDDGKKGGKASWRNKEFGSKWNYW